ncbi:tRNA (N6-isopentenyl adenosine(37)-C2)-methylthiotransferase MiaB [Candidatus Methylacidithermus pantelleriae]|uniref:tRNA-2-methylthio-N(6)-dimethylallyladenosine synthase n=1 Tax=Candidatus Methylacidithermus pantelleriae TaxID=2744239 RepID=A0A8J2BM41_9BACT|nr:tRNA (N6-isopentenyl adenosine(37)-C2)-methylthiotransferase MiaB [Candidatus Methylacidithermus pantelleriae]CAF0689941.1 tRNA-2-methylthio-N(6)-dimethylallyladenosine synthase [Candidatus Methylacidithermus pantelleriae]
MPSVYLKTYGCQMNERDSEQVLRDFLRKGYTLASSEKEADVVLINTCSVRDLADQKALGKMGALAKEKRSKPDLILGFLGCMAQARGEELLKLLPSVDLVVGTQKFHRVADYVETLRKEGGKVVDVSPEKGSQNAIRDHLWLKNKVTAFVSIMQGCNMRCTFCIVPQTRGSERSRPMEEILAEVRELAERGVREVTLLGQIVNLYGRHEFPKRNGQTPFVQLLYAISEVPGILRIRFTSPHPKGFQDDLIEALASLPKLAKHVHLPVQSGSNRILKAMKRVYTVEEYLRLVERLKEKIPDITLGTDIIVGFPGETDEDFLQTKELVRRVGFDQAFIFRYSPRRGTPAAEFPNQVPEEVKYQRNYELLALHETLVREKAKNWIGKVMEVLIEGPTKKDPSRYEGRSQWNHLVIVPGDPRLLGRLVQVQITETTGHTYYGHVIAREGSSGDWEPWEATPPKPVRSP